MDDKKRFLDDKEEEIKKITEESENISDAEKISNNNATENEVMIPRKKVKKYKKVKKIKKQNPTFSESDGCLLAILGMIFPYVGIILYLIWRKSKPDAAISVLKGSWISIIFVAIILSIIFGISFLSNYIGL